MAEQKTTKVWYNSCYGGISFSEEAQKMYKELTGQELNSHGFNHSRHDPHIIAIIETLGSKSASRQFSKLRIEEINSNRYRIREYDGSESVETPESIDWVEIS